MTFFRTKERQKYGKRKTQDYKIGMTNNMQSFQL